MTLKSCHVRPARTERLRSAPAALLSLAVLLPALAGCTTPLEPAHVVSVFLDTDTGSDHDYVVSVLQGGAVVASRDASAQAGFPFRAIVMAPSVEGRDAEVRISEAGVTLASSVVKPHECPSGEVAVTIAATDADVTIEARCS